MKIRTPCVQFLVRGKLLYSGTSEPEEPKRCTAGVLFTGKFIKIVHIQSVAQHFCPFYHEENP